LSYSRYADWFDEALDDYAAALDLYRAGRYSKACFFAHQASEKALKALMIKKLRRYKHTHSVLELLREVSGVVRVDESLFRKADILDRFYVPTRYPNAWPSGAPHTHYDKEDAELALSYAREVIELVKREVEGDP
jgi:HEPN domain-containing protein